MADLRIVSHSSIDIQKNTIFSKDTWLHEDLGYKKHEINSSHSKSLSFKKYSISWLIDLVKET